jgi:hypothetical protein
MNGVFDAQAVIEVLQIDAALQENVLAVVDQLGVVRTGSAGGGPGRGAATEKISRFVKIDVEPGVGQRGRCGEASKAAPDYGNGRHQAALTSAGRKAGIIIIIAGGQKRERNPPVQRSFSTRLPGWMMAS